VDWEQYRGAPWAEEDRRKADEKRETKERRQQVKARRRYAKSLKQQQKVNAKRLERYRQSLTTRRR